MVQSKEWQWEIVKDTIWLEPSEESRFYCEKWKREGRKSLLDIGAGLGRHSILFAVHHFAVSAVDLSEYAINYLNHWSEKEGLSISTKVCDMKKLPFPDQTFDCIWAYHSISHTDSLGFAEILEDVERVLKPGGEIYLSLASKDSGNYSKGLLPQLDRNTIIKTEEGPEKGIPHFYVDLGDILTLFKHFKIERVRHVDDCYSQGEITDNKHYFILARLHK
ncbi:class I SAM-dependent methyltransferase [Paenibacillus sp. S150]|uniref:class I SAM-dependent methyltransferase n=1 Tax=Paenibacillus sp. S150 TaxID=2749826 RepID=UPI001C58EA17|nr:class I SAM-dependent methyltransferase [Paenibacillus sp. S150]MBW4085041.1 methyltransferase domain-containing protein [Paenibacillus sp. S150]